VICSSGVLPLRAKRLSILTGIQRITASQLSVADINLCIGYKENSQFLIAKSKNNNLYKPQKKAMKSPDTGA
jgi:hypothetical protein